MTKKIPEKIKPILEEAKKRLREVYGDRLKGVILYGSYARGDADEGSDIDLIVLLESVVNPVDELERCAKKIHQLDFLYDTVISIIPFDVTQYNTRKLPIILNTKREGIPI